MSFLAPSRLWLLLVVAAAVAAYVFLQRRRRHYAVRFTNLDLLSSVAPKRPGWRRHVAAALTAVGLVALVVALARPVRDEAVPREDATLMLVIDVSGSMQATDVSPTRLAAAVAAAQDFVEQVPATYQVGLVAYDDNASVLATPSTDRGELLAALSALTTGTGTATGDAIDVAVGAIVASQSADASSLAADATTAPSASIVLLSDGKSTVGSSVDAAAQSAADAGIPVTTIAYGTADGTVDVDGQTVAVPSDEAAMNAIAEATGGQSYTAASSDQLSSVYESIQHHVGTMTEPREVLRFFLAVGIVFLLAGAIASMVWTGRFL